MGKVFYGGGKLGMKAPITGILASELAVGSTVKLNVNGVAKDFIVVHQGLPSSMYDESCNGTWLLMKDVYEKRTWHSEAIDKYDESDVHSYLNGDFFALFDSNAQAAIKQAKIPYFKSSGYGAGSVQSGENGLSAKIFLPAGGEVGGATTGNYVADGSAWSYFSAPISTNGTTQRKAYMNGSVTQWWLRSPYLNWRASTSPVQYVTSGGEIQYRNANITTDGIRPALILPSNALFDETTLLFKGVA